MGDFPIPAASLSAYRGALHRPSDLIREGFWFWGLVLTDDVEVGEGRVLPRGTDGMCLFPIDCDEVPVGFPYETAIPFLAHEAPFSPEPWSAWAPVPYDRVGVDGETPGPMRPWSALSAEAVGSVIETVRAQGSVLVAETDPKRAGPGDAGTSASADLVQDSDGEPCVRVSWAGEAGSGVAFLRIPDIWVDFGPDFAYLHRSDGLAVLANRDLAGIALANGPRQGKGGRCDPASLMNSFVRHWRNPTSTARDAAAVLSNRHLRGLP